MTEIGKHRPARDVQPGWQIRCADGEWREVQIYMHTDNILTGQKLLRVTFTDGSGAAADLGDDVMTRTIPEVRRAAKEPTR